MKKENKTNNDDDGDDDENRDGDDGRWTMDTVIRNTATPDGDVNGKYVYVYVSTGAMLHSIHIQLISQNQSLLTAIENQIIIKRLKQQKRKQNQQRRRW